MKTNSDTDFFLKSVKGQEKLFYFLANMPLLIKEKHEISLYSTKKSAISVSFW